MLQQRDNVGECLVKGERIHVGGFDGAAPQTMQDRVGRLVCDDVL
jgi:hypothetical protein